MAQSTKNISKKSNDTFLNIARDWFKSRGWQAFPFQEKTWSTYLDGYSGLVNAPTGSGKTYSLFMAVALEFIRDNMDDISKRNNGLQLIWVSPIRALTKEIQQSVSRAAKGLGLDWDVAIRSGDTNTTERKKQFSKPPEVLITTPESLHVIMTKKNYPAFFKTVKTIVVDEWHELLGSKRGVQTELFISRLRGIAPSVKIWGISATIGNMDDAVDVLLGIEKPKKWTFIKAEIKKEIKVESVFPDDIDTLPWAGHLGIRMIDKVLPIIYESKTTLIFTNTRAQCEIWYQRFLDKDASLAGIIAMHHGSISRELRDWVEDALYEGSLKAVVCTSSLDLGVDFRPVESIIQIGSPKGVARFVQRAGRSGHQPGAVSKIYFVPTHSLELVEAAALREAIQKQELEERIPYIRSYDVLIQYLMTLSIAEGFNAEEIFNEVKKTYSFFSMIKKEWDEVLAFLLYGGNTLSAYDEYQKVGKVGDVYRVMNKKVALRHRLSIGTIVSDAMLNVKYVKGKKLGSVEEWFLSRIAPGEVFWFAGRPLEMVRIKDMEAQVKNTNKKSGHIPSYMGGRMPLSSEMSKVLRQKMFEFNAGRIEDKEMDVLTPLFELQRERSVLPEKEEFLIEYFESDEGHHLLMYPFEGRNVHEGMAALLAKRLSRMQPISFSIAMNDYGFELLSDQKMDIEAAITPPLFSVKSLAEDIQASMNAVEMCRRKFRDIACISGLIFQGFPGKVKKNKHLQSSSSLLFQVFKDYDPDNLLYMQAYDEVMTFQLEEVRMRKALERIQNQKMIISKPKQPTPFAFPILVDRLREKLSSERLEDRIRKMTIF